MGMQRHIHIYNMTSKRGITMWYLSIYFLCPEVKSSNQFHVVKFKPVKMLKKLKQIWIALSILILILCLFNIVWKVKCRPEKKMCSPIEFLFFWQSACDIVLYPNEIKHTRLSCNMWRKLAPPPPGSKLWEWMDYSCVWAPPWNILLTPKSLRVTHNYQETKRKWIFYAFALLELGTFTQIE